MRRRLVHVLHSVTLWLDDLSARWSVAQGKPVPEDVVERRRQIGAHRGRRW